MPIEGSRSYPMNAALLGLLGTLIMLYTVSLASADDKLAATILTTAATPVAEVQTAETQLAMAEPLPAETRLAPAAGTPEPAPAPAPAAKKASALAPAAGDDEFDDEYADEYTGYDADPLEPLNRVFFEFNRTVDTLLLRPVSAAYRGIVPEEGRTAVTHFLQNLYTPVTFANSVLQGDPENSFATLWRFLLNSTAGLFGLFDVATEVGLTNRTTDMGQTFALYGADTGPYFVIPLLGPSNVRDALGRLGDVFTFPPNYAEEWAIPLSIGAATAVDARSNNMDLLDDLYHSSIDPYATFRSAYTQRRAEQIRRARIARDKAQAKAIE